MSQISFFDFEYAAQRKRTRHTPSFVKTGQIGLLGIDLLKLISPLRLWQTVSLPGTPSKPSRHRLIDKAKRKNAGTHTPVQTTAEHPFQVITKNHPSWTARARLPLLWNAQKQRVSWDKLRM